MAPVGSLQGTAFLGVMGDMDVVPLFGSAFVLYFPILISVFCVATALNLWQYALRCLGIKTFQFVESKASEVEKEGMSLLDNAKRRRALGRAAHSGDEDNVLSVAADATARAAEAAAQGTRKMLSFFGIGSDPGLTLLLCCVCVVCVLCVCWVCVCVRSCVRACVRVCLL
jgi:hypothetical protein